MTIGIVGIIWIGHVDTDFQGPHDWIPVRGQEKNGEWDLWDLGHY